MRECVIPGMEQGFQDYDSDRYKELQCTTCHGEDPNSVGYAMPALFPLDWSQIDTEGAAYQFMANTVVPDMAALLGVEPYDPKTQQGFGCSDCHASE